MMMASGYGSSTMEWPAQLIGGSNVGYVPSSGTVPHLGYLARELFRTSTPIEPQIMATLRRIVQVFIADPDENVPLQDSLLYKGEQKLTDLTDQELFFEINIVPLLEAHNQKRVLLVDKEATKRSGKDVRLEPAKIRELKMTVVNIATF